MKHNSNFCLAVITSLRCEYLKYKSILYFIIIQLFVKLVTFYEGDTICSLIFSTLTTDLSWNSNLP